jgi:hypothetical protein
VRPQLSRPQIERSVLHIEEQRVSVERYGGYRQIGLREH